MTRELLLARQLIEALVDPDASRDEAEAAALEVGEIASRLGVDPGRTLPVETFEGMEADDLSPSAWLYLLENRPESEPEIPIKLLDSLYLEHSDPALRFRLIRGALSQPRTREMGLRKVGGAAMVMLEDLPATFPRYRIEQLEKLAAHAGEAGGDEVARALQEIVLYLLQDGSPAALAVAAAAVTSDEDWRRPARALIRATILRVGLDSDYAAPFTQVPPD